MVPFFRTRSLHREAQAPPELKRAHPSERAPCPLGVVAPDAGACPGRELPLRDIDLATPASPHTAARPGRRQRHPQSPWVARWARSASVTVAGAALSMPSAVVFDSLEDSRGRGEFSGREAHRFPRQGRVGISQAV